MTDLQKVLYQYAQERLVMGLLYRDREEWHQAERAEELAQDRLEELGPKVATLARQLCDRQVERFSLEQEAVFLAGLSLGLELGRG